MIPESLIGNEEALAKTLRKSLEALLRRLDRTRDARIGGMSWSVHQGMAKATNMPDTDAAVWLMLSRVEPDPESPFQADGFFGVWQVQFIFRDTGNDRYGFAQEKPIEAMGGALRVLTESLDDVSLDGAVDDLEVVGMEQAIGEVAGDMAVSEWQVLVRAYHPLIVHDRAP